MLEAAHDEMQLYLEQFKKGSKLRLWQYRLAMDDKIGLVAMVVERRFLVEEMDGR